MKAILVAILLVVVASAITDEELHSKFVDWKAKHSKQYDTALEHVQRFENFKNAHSIVRHLNRQGRGYFALNQFADLSQEEFESKYLSPIRTPERKGLETVQYDPKKNYPDTYDWRDHGAVNPIKNQASCGSCWAFSAVQNMEGIYFINHGVLPSLSEQQLVDCEHDCMQYSGQKVCDQGCNGGLMPNAFTYAIREGMETEAEYAYTAKTGTCKYDKTKATFEFKKWSMVGNNESAMVAAINDIGPLSIAVCASSWSYYSGGIFDSTCGTSLNHGVGLVGYGEEGGKQYWIVRNSWGTSWGISGYMKLIRGKNKCAVNNFVCTIQIDK